jgi:photosystem II stability/assembly factor-like uncharacterized protein
MMRRTASKTFPAALLLAIAFGLAPSNPARAAEYEFSWRLPTPQGNALGGTDFEDATTGYAVGPRGTVLYTTDAGVTWTQRDLFPDFGADLEDVLVRGPGHLLAVGSAPGIFESTDAGVSWSPVANPSTTTLTDLEVVAGSILSAVGNNGQVLRSTDAGASWALLSSAGPNDLHEQVWLDPSNGYVLGTFLARRTTDGGQTWAPLNGVSESEAFSEGFFTDASHGTILSDFHVWKTTNAGASWTGTQVNPITYMGNAIVFGPLHYLVCTNFEGATVWETTDGGDNWTNRLYSGLGGFLDLDLLDDGTLILPSSEGDLYRSTDNGQSWTNTTYAAFEHPRGIIGAIGVGPGGSGAAGTAGSPPTFWLHTPDGGSTWEPQPDGPAISFTREIVYWDAARAVAAGDYGRMWRTTNGGTSWTSVDLPSPPVNGQAFHISTPASGTAFAAVFGQTQSKVYRTTDFGATWEVRSTGLPATSGLLAISFLDTSTGFVGGYANGLPILYRTTDGGASWSPAGTTGLMNYMLDMHWVDAQTGFATVPTGSTGIYRTTNGGGIWNRVWAGTATDLSFAPDNIHGGVTTGSFYVDGSIVITEDGGVTWEDLTLPAAIGGSCITAVEDGFWVGGGANCIMKATRIDPASVDGSPPSGGDAAGAILRARPIVGERFEIDLRPARDGSFDLGVFDVLGRRVAVLDGGTTRPIDPAAPPRTVVWNGLTGDGRPAPAGPYFIRLAMGGETHAVKVILQR